MYTIQILEKVSRKVLFSHECDNNTVAKTLEYAVARNTDLRGANLCGANLSDADLRNAYLSDADLRGANLCGANLSDADLRNADLSDAYLRDADLRNADLRYADLRNADLRRADLHTALGLYNACPVEGSFIGWKKASGFIVKLLIPADALRSSATSTKCRCNKAFVEDIQTVNGGATGIHSVASNYDSMFKYVRGSWVEVKDFDTNRWNECAPGVHFFVDRREAVDYE